MQQFFDNLENRLETMPSKTVDVWTFTLWLKTDTIEGIDPFDVILASNDRLHRVLGWHTLGTAFLTDCRGRFEDYREIDCGSSYIWPSLWDIAARNRDQAIKRINELITLLTQFARQDEWMPSFHERPDYSAHYIRTFKPLDLEINYPNHKLWTTPDLDTVDPDTAVKALDKAASIHRLELRTSTVAEASRSLHALATLLPMVQIDSYNWKWVIIAAHNCLQNFMVAALEGTSPGRVLEPSRSGQYGLSPSRPRLLSFPELYSRVKKEEYMSQNIYSRRYRPKGDEGSSIKWLNNLRNDLTHFDPKTLILEPEIIFRLPRMLLEILNVVDFLAFESRNVRWNIYPIYKVETALILKELRAHLEEITGFYWSENVRLDLGLTRNQIKAKAGP